MKLSKGAYCNLINRYRAVLKKCHLLNTFGSLAVAAMLVMGGASAVQAAPEETWLGYGGSVQVSSLADTVGDYTVDVDVPETATKIDTSDIAEITDEQNADGVSGTCKGVLLTGNDRINCHR